MDLDLRLNFDVIKYSINILQYNTKLQTLNIPQKVKKDIVIEDFRYFSNFLNIKISLSDLRALSLGINKIDESFDEKVLSSYRSVNELILSPIIERQDFLSVTTLMRINKLLTEKVFELWESGKIRIKEFPYQNKFDIWEMDNLVSDDLVMDQINTLSKFYFDDNIPQFIKIPVIGFNLFRLKPFSVFNDMTIIVILKMLLLKEGIIDCISLMDIFYNNVNDLNPADMTMDKWGISLMSKISSTIENLYLYVSNFINLNHRKIVSDIDLKILTIREKEAFFYLIEHKIITRREYAKVFNVSAMTAFRDLDHMRRSNIISQFGTGRGVKYTIQERFLL